MSGHSKWSKIKRKKGVNDARRSANFTKLANAISLAARGGSDPDTNFKLKMAIDKAKSNSLPKDNIDRAIKRGTGEIEGQQIEELTYEGYGPEGVAIIVEIVTDNKNRSSQEVKHILSKYGGKLAGPGSVMWQFDYKGVVTLELDKLDDDTQLLLIDAGAEDIKTDGGITLITQTDNLNILKNKVVELKLPLIDHILEYVPKETVKPTNENSLLKLFDELDECDDVNNFFSNADL
ncbi:YebC/PmpR family DNA-binding transcriptional regulator [bacterium]|jgi:YebC/PmpR family DNA-binding regulatory protein|nr:YebC/PmpR family DNA-binding transcriptional regulator [bacterium]MBT4121748.1 YebC/PmpR family DNA-binding transcriptional regulator [bacterium]MBT4335529.1 YebC/PmpR family DNA-binding transcriptional regulator [bacterium]MBT4495416.1 YebC/PmpR family DNA-binding transcriptional regulator [bacterium]MBT4763641.1 YebC/PmpR family DNA-binding transcriptional regulator [bacterium]